MLIYIFIILSYLIKYIEDIDYFPIRRVIDCLKILSNHVLIRANVTPHSLYLNWHRTPFAHLKKNKIFYCEIVLLRHHLQLESYYIIVIR